MQVRRLREGGLMVARCSVGAVALPGEGKCLELKAGPEGSTTSSNEALVFINETVRCVRVRERVHARARTFGCGGGLELAQGPRDSFLVIEPRTSGFLRTRFPVGIVWVGEGRSEIVALCEELLEKAF